MTVDVATFPIQCNEDDDYADGEDAAGDDERTIVKRWDHDHHPDFWLAEYKVHARGQ